MLQHRRKIGTAILTGLGFLGLVGRAASAQATGAILRATVADASTGVLLTDAQVIVRGLGISSRTNILGDARIVGISAGTHTVEARLLGYVPSNARATFSSGDSVELLLLLVPGSQRLPTVTVTDSLSLFLHEFENRRRRGTGRYITQAELRASHGRAFGDILLSKMPGVRVAVDGTVYSTRGSNSFGLKCPVTLWYNGVRGPPPIDFRSGGGSDIVQLGLLGGIEYYNPGYVPIQYRDGAAACGVMLLWSSF